MLERCNTFLKTIFGPVIRSIFAHYFNSVTLPATLPSKNGGPTPVIVTFSTSPVIAALLDSFARRAGYGKHANYGLPSDPSTKELHWISLHDKNILQQLTTGTGFKFLCLSIFELSGPIHSNPRYRLSWGRILFIVLFARTMYISFGKPFSIDGGLTAQRIQRNFKLEFYRDLKLVRGTPFQSVETQSELALSGADFDRELGLIAAKMRISKEKAFRLARKEFFAVAANPVRPFYSTASRVCRVMISRLFSDVICTGLDDFAEAARKSTIVLVPMHRSHLDYILVGLKLYESKVNPPLVAAGVNLSFWPIGYFIRSLGAYFVKRNARYDRIHALVLKRYVTYLVKRGHAQEFFIEGGRSRSGRMRSPKVGLLSIMVEAWLKGLRKELAFVPVSITYENVVEDKSFGEENTGQAKQKESLLSLLKVGSIFKKSYGEVMLHFGTPISLSALSSELQNGGDSRKLVKKLASTLTSAIQIQSNVSLTGLIYTALMCAPKYGLTRQALSSAVRGLAEVAEIARSIDPRYGAITPSLERFLSGSEGALNDIVRGGTVERGQVLGHEVYYIRGKRRYTADFYKNSLLHLFFPLAVLSCLDLSRSPFKIEDCALYHLIFQSDLILSPLEQFQTELRKWVSALAKRGIVIVEGEKIRFASHHGPQFMPTLLVGYLEAIVWVFDNIKWLTSGDRKVAYKGLMDQLQSDFRTGMYLGAMSRTEASSNSSVQFALEILAGLGVIQIQESGGTTQEIVLLKETFPELEQLRGAHSAIWRWQMERREAL